MILKYYSDYSLVYPACNAFIDILSNGVVFYFLPNYC